MAQQRKANACLESLMNLELMERRKEQTNSTAVLSFTCVLQHTCTHTYDNKQILKISDLGR